MSWKTNTAMEWKRSSDPSPLKVTDHNRSPVDISIERIEKKARMVDGTLRRYTVAKKRTFSVSWEMLPHSNSTGRANALTTVDGGMDGMAMEAFHNTTDGPFTLTLRSGKDISTEPDGTPTTYEVMISDFSKEIIKRGLVDFWNLSITLEEV